MKHKNNRAEIDIKSILVGLLFIVLVAGLFSVLINDFTGQYGVDAAASSAFLNSIGANSTEYQELIGEYNETLFKDRASSTTDWIDFMWKAAWSVMKSTATLPVEVVSIVSTGLVQMGVPMQIQVIIISFISAIIMLIIIWWIITKMPGMFK